MLQEFLQKVDTSMPEHVLARMREALNARRPGGGHPQRRAAGAGKRGRRLR